MANKRWVGKSATVAQVRSWLFGGTWVATETVTATAGQRSATVVVGSTNIATILTTIRDALNGLASASYPELAEATWSADSTHLLATSDTAGKPIYPTLTTNSAAGTIGAAADTTANAGPNDVRTPANWSPAGAIANSDALYIDPDATDDLLYGLDSTAAVTGLTITHTGMVKVGLPPTNVDGTAYPEYRPTYWQTAGGTANVGAASAGQAVQGTSRFKWDAQATAATLNVYLTGFGADSGMEAVLFKGTNAANVVNVSGQSQVGLAVFGGEVITVATLNVTGQQAYVRAPGGITVTAVNNNGGQVELNPATGALALVQNGGQTTVNGTSAVASVTGLGGAVVYNTSGTLGGAPVLYNGTVLDFSQDSRAKTVTNPIDLFSGAAVFDPLKVVNAGGNLVIDFNGFDPGLGLGANVRITRSATA